MTELEVDSWSLVSELGSLMVKVVDLKEVETCWFVWSELFGHSKEIQYFVGKKKWEIVWFLDFAYACFHIEVIGFWESVWLLVAVELQNWEHNEQENIGQLLITWYEACLNFLTCSGAAMRFSFAGLLSDSQES